MNAEYKFWFDTGVLPHNRPYDSLMEHQAWRGGTMQIAFYLESSPPEGYTLAHLCNNPEVNDWSIAIPVIGGGMLSKFAVFIRTKGSTR